MIRCDILRTIAGAGLVAGVGLLGGCWPLRRKASARVRLHVEVMTRQGLRQGSGVLELINEKLPTFGIPNVHQGAVGMRGQAVIVDLPDGALFALLRLPGDADTAGLTNAIEKALVPRDPQDLSAETGIKGLWSSTALGGSDLLHGSGNDNSRTAFFLRGSRRLAA